MIYIIIHKHNDKSNIIEITESDFRDYVNDNMILQSVLQSFGIIKIYPSTTNYIRTKYKITNTFVIINLNFDVTKLDNIDSINSYNKQKDIVLKTLLENRIEKLKQLIK